MRSLTIAATICILAVAPAFCQQNTTKESAPSTPVKEDMVVLSGRVTTAKLADPNTPVVFNGYVMRVADFLAAMSANNEAVQRLCSQETHVADPSLGRTE